MASLPAAIAAAQADADRISEPLAAAAAALDYDVAAAFASGAWLDELAAAASAAGVVLVRRDGRVIAYPWRFGSMHARRACGSGASSRGASGQVLLRPAQRLQQQRPARFNARQFLDRLFLLYDDQGPGEDPAWRPARPGQGPLVSLADLHDLMTVLPAASADYPQEEFIADLLRLDRQPDATDSHGRCFELGGSTGRKAGKRLTVV